MKKGASTVTRKGQPPRKGNGVAVWALIVVSDESQRGTLPISANGRAKLPSHTAGA
jgi:hypothetical protein